MRKKWWISENPPYNFRPLSLSKRLLPLVARPSTSSGTDFGLFSTEQ
jgi:hypothetical protein